MSPQLIYPLIVAGVMPYVFTSMSRFRAFGPSQNHRTRDWQAELTGWRRRAHWAQQNSFEVFPVFAAAVLTFALRVPEAAIATPIGVALAWAFIVLRIVFGVCYIKSWARARSIVFYISMGLVTALFVLAAIGSQ